MHIKLLAHGQKYLYKEPVMYMAITEENRLPFIFAGIKVYSDYDLLDLFERDGISKAIVISGLDTDEGMVEVRAFIFAARKRFDPGTRPRIIIYTKHTIDDLRRKSFTGLESELLQYGNCILITKRKDMPDQTELFQKLGIGFLLGKKLEIHSYIGHQYE